MIKFSRLHYCPRVSDVEELIPEEFETWKVNRSLDDPYYLLRRDTLQKIADSYLEAYFEGVLSLDGKKGILESLKSICTTNDTALLGRIIFEALEHPPKTTKPGNSKSNRFLKSQVRTYLKFLKQERETNDPPFGFSSSITFEDRIIHYPGKTYEERAALIYDRYKKLGFGDIVFSMGSVLELARKPRDKRPKESKKPKSKS